MKEHEVQSVFIFGIKLLTSLMGCCIVSDLSRFFNYQLLFSQIYFSVKWLELFTWFIHFWMEFPQDCVLILKCEALPEFAVSDISLSVDLLNWDNFTEKTMKIYIICGYVVIDSGFIY